jgi:hypothetical protein
MMSKSVALAVEKARNLVGMGFGDSGTESLEQDLHYNDGNQTGNILQFSTVIFKSIG